MLFVGLMVCVFAWGLVNKFYCNTWFSQDYVDGVISTSHGCMAGTPPADIIYALAFSRVLFNYNKVFFCLYHSEYCSIAFSVKYRNIIFTHIRKPNY